ncbi:energy-coupling factor ABC transporter ATP-binding protein [Tropicimonas sp. IMCC34043]|uniref:energy-coupling factor ABC transporter ATP-binding protein n=1 Tax=Tropicimonas sp. IMCC34043 TaxID=2248760 RepID=UPI001E6288D5|nr:ABC transporter ATP-binding protein [Tropicimonas sp. IMCC34043]
MTMQSPLPPKAAASDPNARSSAAPSPVLKLAGVTLRLGQHEVLSGIDLRADERRIGIVGRNGSGKTTLARLLAGLVAPTEGTAEISGVDMAKDRKAALRKVGILFQNPDHQIIFPIVEEEIGFGLTQMGLPKAEAAARSHAMLERFDKAHWAKAPVHSLSQGQKQLLCLMAVLAMEPALIILDEPFSGLDIPTRMQLMRYLDGVEASIVLISHDPAALRDFDRVIWLEAGRVREDGAAGPVLTRFERQMRLWGEEDDLSDLSG